MSSKVQYSYNNLGLDINDKELFTNRIENIITITAPLNFEVVIGSKPFNFIRKSGVVYPLVNGVTYFNIDDSEGFLLQGNEIFYLMRV